MNLETAQSVIQKQAMQVANLTLQNTMAEVELEEAKAQIQKLEAQLSKLQNAGQKGAEDDNE